MRFSVWPGSHRPWDEVLSTALTAEREGWDGLWFADHFMPNTPSGDGPTLEVWAVLAALAHATDRLRLGPLVTSVTYRHPAVVANAAAAVDVISGGRLVLGLGAGWQANEHAAYGLELGDVPTRSDRLEEAAGIIRSLLRDDRTTVDGRFFTITDAPNEPKPIQPRLPLLVAGKGERRTLRTAARYADEWNGWCTADEVGAKRAVLAQHCEEFGRDPATIRCSTQALVQITDDPAAARRFEEATDGRPTLAGSPAAIVDRVGALVEAGADELIVPDWPWDDPTERAEQLHRFITEVAPAFRR